MSLGPTQTPPGSSSPGEQVHLSPLSSADIRMHAVLLLFPVLIAGVRIIMQKEYFTFSQNFHVTVKSMSPSKVDIRG
jgi:hypothetical protein